MHRAVISLRSAFKHDVEGARLKLLTIHFAVFDGDRILDAIHRIVLVCVALEMNLGYEWLITRTDCDEMIMSAAPEIAVGIWSIGNRANTLELVQARLR